MIEKLRAIKFWLWQLKRIIKLLITFALVSAGALFFLHTPDTDFHEMILKYGGPNVQFTKNMPISPYDNNLNIHYRDQGNPNGQPIIFIHGSSASLHIWEKTVAQLGNKYRLISYDQPGHGITGPHPRDDYSAEGMAEALDVVMNKLGIPKAVLVGNSMGGWVSWRYALANPERVEALILIDAAGAPSDKAPLSLGFRLMQNPVTRPLSKIITPRILVKKSIQQTVGDPSTVNDETVDRYWELLRFPGNRRAATLRAITSRNIEYNSRLHEITAPTLILWGEEDQLIYVSDADFFNSAIPNSQKHTYPNIGHIPTEEVPVQVAKDIDVFLQSLPK